MSTPPRPSPVANRHPRPLWDRGPSPLAGMPAPRRPLETVARLVVAAWLASGVARASAPEGGAGEFSVRQEADSITVVHRAEQRWKAGGDRTHGGGLRPLHPPPHRPHP